MIPGYSFKERIVSESLYMLVYFPDSSEVNFYIKLIDTDFGKYFCLVIPYTCATGPLASYGDSRFYSQSLSDFNFSTF